MARMEEKEDWLWFIIGQDGEPTPENDRDRVEAFLRGTGRVVASTDVGGAHIHTVFKPCLYCVDGPDESKDKWWETLLERCSEDSMAAPDYEQCGGPRANALAMHERHVAAAWRYLASLPPPYTSEHPLVKQWEADVYNRSSEIDVRTEREDWYSLALGWALGRGLSPAYARLFASAAPQ